MDHLQLFNEIIKLATPLNSNKAEATSLDQKLVDTGLDSLDLLMVSVYLAEVFDVSEEIAKNVGNSAQTVGDMVNYMHFYRRKDVNNVEEAIKSIQ